MKLLRRRRLGFFFLSLRPILSGSFQFSHSFLEDFWSRASLGWLRRRSPYGKCAKFTRVLYFGSQVPTSNDVYSSNHILLFASSHLSFLPLIFFYHPGFSKAANLFAWAFAMAYQVVPWAVSWFYLSLQTFLRKKNHDTSTINPFWPIIAVFNNGFLACCGIGQRKQPLLLILQRPLVF